MTIQDIINLTNAGYTKADITQLMQAEAPAPPAPAAPAPPAPAAPAPAAPAPAPAQDPKPAPQAAPAPDPALSAIQSQIDTLKQMMQLNNIQTVNQAPAKERTIDDIFAEIINPPALNNKDK